MSSVFIINDPYSLNFTHSHLVSNHAQVSNMAQAPLLDPAIFAALTRDLEEETRVSESPSQTVRQLNQAVGEVQGLLSKVHSTPRSECESCVVSFTN